MSKEQLLDALRQRPGEFVSGAELSPRLRVSRTAIWKWVNGLRQEGYAIESHRKGYRLVAAPDMLTPQEIGDLNCHIIGSRVVYAGEVASTNNWAKELANNGAPEGTVVLADTQSAGKGRLGRTWISPPGTGIWMSLILRPAFPPYEAAKITLMAAVAVCQAIQEVTGVRPGIKWPNDIMLDNRKAGGILVEMNSEMDRIDYLVCGIGLNVNQRGEEFTGDLLLKATSLKEKTGSETSRVKLARSILEHVDQEYAVAIRAGWPPILSQWRNFSVTAGRRVAVVAPGVSYRGKAIDIDESGQLIVCRDDGKTAAVLTGDIEFID